MLKNMGAFLICEFAANKLADAEFLPTAFLTGDAVKLLLLN